MYGLNILRNVMMVNSPSLHNIMESNNYQFPLTITIREEKNIDHVHERLKTM